MTEPIIKITPRNPDIFPVPQVGLPRLQEQDQEQRRREREEEEDVLRAPEERRAPQAERPPTRPQIPPHRGEDGRPHVDVTA